MPSPCTIYSTRVIPFSAEEIRRWSGPRALSVVASETNPSQVQIRWPNSLVNVYLDEPAGGLDRHLDGMRGFIWACAGEKMTAAVYALLQRTYAVRSAVGIMAEPEIGPDAASFLDALAQAAHGFVFKEESFLSSRGELLLAPGRIEEDCRADYWPDALARRTRIEAFLAEKGLRVPSSLPPVAGEQEVVLRSPREVGLRALALAAVASRAIPKGLGRGAAKALVKGHESCLTPSEAGFLDSFFPGSAAKLQFSWRFEALHLLLWAIGWTREIGLPSAPADVARILDLVERAGSFPALTAVQSLRPVSEILDHYDLVYRCHWLTTEARVRQLPPPGWLDAGVVQERHHALNWLTCCRNEEWDDVSTDT